MTNNTEIATVLKNAIKNSSYTQSEIADKIQCSKTTMNSYCQGKRSPSIEKLSKLIDILHIPLEQVIPVFTNGKALYSNKNQLIELTTIYNSLNEQGRQELLIMARNIACNKSNISSENISEVKQVIHKIEGTKND